MIVGVKMRISSVSPPIGGQIWDWMLRGEDSIAVAPPFTVVNVYDVLDFKGLWRVVCVWVGGVCVCVVEGEGD